MTIVVVAATPLEAAGLDPGLADVLITGIGCVNAAHALTTRLLTGPRPALVIQTGIGGAYRGAHLPVGAVALATDEIYGDLGVITPGGWESAETFGFPVVAATPVHPARFNRFPLDTALVQRAAAVAGPRLARTGPFLTLQQVTGVTAIGDALFDRFGALCESMEGAAAAHVCAIHGLPFLEVRGVSNLVEDRNRAAWRIPEAAGAARAVTEHLLAHAATLLAAPEPPR